MVHPPQSRSVGRKQQRVRVCQAPAHKSNSDAVCIANPQTNSTAQERKRELPAHQSNATESCKHHNTSIRPKQTAELNTVAHFLHRNVLSNTNTWTNANSHRVHGGRRRACNGHAARTEAVLQLTTVHNRDRNFYSAGSRAASLHLTNHAHPLHDMAEHHVLAVEPFSLGGGDEELRIVAVRTAVGLHRESRQ